MTELTAVNFFLVGHLNRIRSMAEIKPDLKVYRKESFTSKESDTLRSYRVYISPTMWA